MEIINLAFYNITLLLFYIIFVYPFLKGDTLCTKLVEMKKFLYIFITINN